VKAAAEESKQRQISEDHSASVDVTVRKRDASSEEAVAKEAKKGYDLLLVGVANTAKNGAFHADVAASPLPSKARSPSLSARHPSPATRAQPAAHPRAGEWD